MARMAKNHLSSSTDGALIQVSQTATAGDAIHTGPSTATDFDEVWIYATNTSGSTVTLTLEWAGTGTANNIVTDIPARTMALVVPGLVLQGNATPLTIAAFAGTTNVINVSGFVNSITAT